MKTTKTIVILALAIALTFMAMPVAAAHDYYPDTKIVDTNPALGVPDPLTVGWVTFSIIAGGAQDKTIWVVNNANGNITPFDCTYNPDRTERAGQNPDYVQIKVPGVGTTGILRQQVGNFTAYLQNGEGNQCERRDFSVVGGGVSSQGTQVVFQGAAVSQYTKPADAKDVFVITKATYGATVCHDECREWVEATWSDWSRNKPGNWNTIPYNERESKPVGHGRDSYIVYRYVTVRAHYTEWADCQNRCDRDMNDWSHHNTHRVVCDGEVIDVTQNVQTVVDMGYTSFFFFDNAQNPGGIFSDTNELLSPIEDPAYGIVKHVMIQYTKNGGEYVINTMEYNSITL